MPRFAGPATMMRLPQFASAEGLDACFVGVPLDIGTSNRSGTRHGPRQIRAESCMLRPYNMATRAAPFESLSVADIGDIAINTFDLKKSVDIIEAGFDDILRPTVSRWRWAAIIRSPCRSCAPWQEAWARGAHPRRCPCRHQRRDVRRKDRPRHAVPPRRRRRPAGHRQGVSDRPARLGLLGGRLRLAAPAGLHGGHRRRVLEPLARR
jgi:hypothetical protein